MVDLIGQRLGEYEVIDQVGSGGMANVYRAHQPMMNRDVAIKVVQPSIRTQSDFAAKFEKEAQVIASLSHPHIIKVFGYGVLKGFYLKLLDPKADSRRDLVYFVMELHNGGSLADLIDRGALPTEQVRLLLRNMADALDYAHQKGVIHCDLKPPNILLDENQNAILCDFGIAQLVTERPTEADEGQLAGTPYYMAPEQWDAAPTGSWTDVYALGGIVWEMLTGRPLFAGDSVAELYIAHTTEPIPRLLDLRPDLPPALQEVFEKALAKDSNERYKLAGQLAANFEIALGYKKSRLSIPTQPPDSPLESQPAPTPTPTTEPSIDRRPLIGGAILAAVGIVFFILSIVVFVNARSRTPNGNAETGWLPAGINAESAVGTLAAATGTASAVQGSHRISLQTLSPDGALERTIQAVVTRAPPQSGTTR